jgi:hypothetical protein
VPGVSGLIAAVFGTTLQVQGNGEQTAVVYSATTTITAQAASSASAVKVGDCVSAGEATTGGQSGATSTPSVGGTAGTTVAATTVTILSSDGKGCQSAESGLGGPGFRSGNGTRPAGAPTGVPSDRPTGGFGNRAGGFGGFGAVGEVTAVSGGRLTLTETVRLFDGGTAGGPTASPTTTTRTVTVSYTSATAFLATTKATASAIKVGDCVRALGRADDTGAITASSLALSPAVSGSCASAVRGG